MSLTVVVGRSRDKDLFAGASTDKIHAGFTTDEIDRLHEYLRVAIDQNDLARVKDILLTGVVLEHQGVSVLDYAELDDRSEIMKALRDYQAARMTVST